MIKTSKIDYRGEDRLKVEFPYDVDMASQIRQIVGSACSRFIRVRLVPYTRETMEVFKKYIP